MFDPHAWPGTLQTGGTVAAGSRLQNFMLPCTVTRHTSPTEQAPPEEIGPGELAEPVIGPASVAPLPAADIEAPPAAAGAANEPATVPARGGAQPPHSVVMRSELHGIQPVLSPPGQMHSMKPSLQRSASCKNWACELPSMISVPVTRR